jgi:hypothetical protein
MSYIGKTNDEYKEGGFNWQKKYSIAGPCGIICDNCEYLLGKKEQKCSGCIAQEGNPFWGKCQAYRCAQEHQVEHCGECSDFPCENLINEYYDPNRPRGKQEAVFRIGQLAIRKKIGTAKWLKRRFDKTIVGFDD